MASGCLMFEMAAATASESNHTQIMRLCHLGFITDTSRDMGLTIRTLCLKECQFPLRNSVFWVHVCTAPDPKNIYVGYMWDILAFWDGNRNNHGKRSHIYPTHIQLFPSYLYHYNMGITGIHWVGICQNPWIYQGTSP